MISIEISSAWNKKTKEIPGNRVKVEGKGRFPGAGKGERKGGN